MHYWTKSSVTLPHVYAFDAGKTFPGTSLFEYVGDLHAKGIQIDWNVGAADVHVHCNPAPCHSRLVFGMGT
jgi:hypothetical protein